MASLPVRRAGRGFGGFWSSSVKADDGNSNRADVIRGGKINLVKGNSMEREIEGLIGLKVSISRGLHISGLIGGWRERYVV